MKKVDNSANSLQAKIDLRRKVLAAVQPSRVLDVFCGDVGEMWSGAWREASAYVGIDKRWRLADQRSRFVGDSLRVLRALDLQQFNVFDVDPYGSPWEAMTIIAARRKWAHGEIGAVVVTDGSSMKSRWGTLPNAMRSLIGIRGPCAPSQAGAEGAIVAAWRAWARRSRVEPTLAWRALGGGQSAMRYDALVFRGSASVPRTGR